MTADRAEQQNPASQWITPVITNRYDLAILSACGISHAMMSNSYDMNELLAKIRICNGNAAAAPLWLRTSWLNEALRYGQLVQRSLQTPVLAETISGRLSQRITPWTMTWPTSRPRVPPAACEETADGELLVT